MTRSPAPRPAEPTLWDLAAPSPEPAQAAPQPAPRAAATRSRRSTARPAAPARPERVARVNRVDRYESLTRGMLARYGIKVRKWRSSMSGVAWTLTFRDGSVSRLIASPKPKGPMSAAVFLHEVGHHAIGIGAVKPRCLEEFAAWAFSIEHMRLHGIPITPRVATRVERSLRYAVGKARRRGLQSLPDALLAFDRPLHAPLEQAADIAAALLPPPA